MRGRQYRKNNSFHDLTFISNCQNNTLCTHNKTTQKREGRQRTRKLHCSLTLSKNKQGRITLSKKLPLVLFLSIMAVAPMAPKELKDALQVGWRGPRAHPRRATLQQDNSARMAMELSGAGIGDQR